MHGQILLDISAEISKMSATFKTLMLHTGIFVQKETTLVFIRVCYKIQKWMVTLCNYSASLRIVSAGFF